VTKSELSVLHSNRLTSDFPVSFPENVNVIEFDWVLLLLERLTFFPSTAESIEVVGGATSRNTASRVHQQVRSKATVHPDSRIGGVLVVVVGQVGEAAEVGGIDDRALANIARSETLIDVVAIDIRSSANARVDAISEHVRRRYVTDEPVTGVLLRVVVLEPERVVVEAVVPVELTVRRPVVDGTALVVSIAQRIEIDLPAEPHELLEHALGVTDTRAVEAGIPNVLQAGVRAQTVVDLERGIEQAVHLVERVVRDVALNLVRSERHARIRPLGAAAERDVVREGVTGIEEAFDVVRVRNPRNRDQ